MNLIDCQDTVFISDLDGTLLDQSALLPEKSREILTRLIEAGLPLTIATARSWQSSRVALNGLQLKLPVVTYNGALILDPVSEQVIHAEIFNQQQKWELFERCKKLAGSPLVYARIDGKDHVSWQKGQETEGILQYIGDRSNDPRLRGVNTPEELLQGDVLHFTVIDTRDALTPVFEQLKDFPGIHLNIQNDVYHVNEFWLEIMPSNATKAHGVEALSEHLGKKKIIVFGDNVNDMPMFRIAAEGYATANATDELKALATSVIGSCEENGVACYLQERFHADS